MPELLELPPEKIIVVPDGNPRLTFLPDVIENLKKSVYVHGILVPFLVGELSADLGGHPLKDGYQRFHVGKLLGLKKYPCLVVKGDGIQTLETQLATYCRSDLPPYEQFLAYRGWMEATGGTAKALAEKVGKDPAQVCRVLSLSKCIPAVQEAARDGKLNVSGYNAYSKLSAAEQEAKWNAKKESVSKLKIPLNTDLATGEVVLTGVSDFEGAEELLKAAMKAIKSAKEKNFSLKTAQSTWKDMAEA